MIHVRGLARTFRTKSGPVDAVCGIDADVSAGEIVGLLGPNGAGKTTTLRMLTTLLKPTAGTASVAGIDVAADARAVRRRIGYVAQIGATPAPGTRLAEELVAQARLQGLSKAAAADRLRVLLPRLDLSEFEGRALSEMSGGQRRRFDIALGLMHDPKLVFLDEPTTGLDPQSRANMWEHIRSLRDEHGVTVVITTHYLDEADALADRLLVMDHGRIVADDTGDALKAQISGDAIHIRFADRADPAAIERSAEAVADAVPVRTTTLDGRHLIVNVDVGDVAVAAVLRVLDRAGLDVASVRVVRPTLDDVFLNLTGRALRDDAA